MIIIKGERYCIVTGPAVDISCTTSEGVISISTKNFDIASPFYGVITRTSIRSDYIAVGRR